MFKKYILIRVRSKVIEVSIGSLLCKSSLRIQDLIQLGNTFLIHSLDGTQELLSQSNWDCCHIRIRKH